MILCLCLNPAIDRYGEVSSFYYEEPMNLTNIQEEVGGKTINISRVLTRFNISNQCLFFSGSRSFLEQELKREDISYESIVIQDKVRVNHSILDKSTNRIMKYNMPGPAIRSSEWKSMRQRVLSTDNKTNFLVFSGSLPPGVSDKELCHLLKKWKQQTGGRVVVDTRPEVLTEVIRERCADVILPNLPEAESVAGHSLESESDLRDLLLRVQKNIPQMIITAGYKGAYYLDDHHNLQQKFSPAITLKSSVGAGDAFAAGLIMALSEGQSLEAALELAVRCGAATCERPGTGMCGPGDVKKI